MVNTMLSANRAHAADLSEFQAGNKTRERLQSHPGNSRLEQPSGALRISAVMPVYNESDVIYWSIRALVEQRIFVHVLDNESTDNTATIAKGFPEGAVKVSQFYTDGQFNEKLQGEAVGKAFRELEEASDWLIKCDADEFLEAPYEGMSLRQGIGMVDRQGFNCIGVRSFCFFPMSAERPHVAGEDVRRYYDHFRIWDGVDRWDPSLHPQANMLWKINMFKVRSGLFYFDPHRLSPFENINLFPNLFILRHYPFRHPALTRCRLVLERRDRMSDWNLANNVSCHYTKYSERDTFLFDDQIAEMRRWSEFKKL